jgi:hypothetical protein
MHSIKRVSILPEGSYFSIVYIITFPLKHNPIRTLMENHFFLGLQVHEDLCT